MNLLTISYLFSLMCTSLIGVSGQATDCYNQLGCFPNTDPWSNIKRPFPKPDTPTNIDTKLTLYTRTSTGGFSVRLWPTILPTRDFILSRNKTVFITHGFSNNGSAPWMHEIKNAYLRKVDANVFIVDWGKGAQTINYLQAASNTRIVGAEIGRFINNTRQRGLDLKNVHLIGHSLGAHVSSYAAKWFSNTSTKIGRITALDPAQPGFEFNDARVRLNASDASFIDVLHSNAQAFIPFLGFGMISPVGDVDFYLNGGTLQPGCVAVDFSSLGNVTSISDLSKVPVDILLDLVGCSHGRAYEVFISAIKSNGNCTFLGNKMSKFDYDIQIASFGLVPFIPSSCTTDTCTYIGLETPSYPARGSFYVKTASNPPYCQEYSSSSPSKLTDLLTSGLNKTTSSLLDALANLFNSG